MTAKDKQLEQAQGIPAATCLYCGKLNPVTGQWCWVCHSPLHTIPVAQAMPPYARKSNVWQILAYVFLGIAAAGVLLVAVLIALFFFCVSLMQGPYR